MRALTVIDYPSYTLSVLCLPWFDFVGSSGRKAFCFMLSCCSVISLEHYQPQSLCITWPAFPPTYLCDLQAPAILPWSFQSRSSISFSSAFYNTTSCLQELVLFSTSSLCKLGLPSPSQFSQPNRIIKWMILSRHFNWKIQDMQPLFGHGVIKAYNKATWWVQLRSCRVSYLHPNPQLSTVC